MFINEKSLHVSHLDYNGVNICLKEFFKLYKTYVDKTSLTELYLANECVFDFSQNSVKFSDWQKNPQTDKEDMRFLGLINQKIKYVEPNFNEESKIYSENSLSAHHVYNNESILVSFQTIEYFDKSRLPCTLFMLDEDSGDFCEINVEIPHVSFFGHLENEYVNNFLQLIDRSIDSYAKLWEMREELFPNLIFLIVLKSNLSKLVKNI